MHIWIEVDSTITLNGISLLPLRYEKNDAQRMRLGCRMFFRVRVFL